MIAEEIRYGIFVLMVAVHIPASSFIGKYYKNP